MSEGHIPTARLPSEQQFGGAALRPSILGALLLLCSGCGGGGPTSGSAMPPTPTPAPTPTPTPEPNASNRRLDLAVMVDSLGPQTSREEIERVAARANAKLLEKTGEQLRLTDVVYGLPGTPSAFEMAAAFLATEAENPPESIMVLTDDETARIFGGYSFQLSPPFPYLSEYPSPAQHVGSDKVYGGAIHFDHLYARCGYDDRLNRVSDVSFGGECRNRDGVVCVQSGAFWVCPDSLDDQYADHDYFTACTLVHEILHSFGDEGNFDHWGTAQCRDRTGMSTATAGDLFQFQSHCGMCPDLFDALAASRGG